MSRNTNFDLEATLYEIAIAVSLIAILAIGVAVYFWVVP